MFSVRPFPRTLAILSLLVLPLARDSVWGDPATGKRANIARGRIYQLWPEPAYRHCADQDDDLQLTDGVYSAGKHIWVEKTTVGWCLHRTVFRYVLINIDLGAVRAVGGLKYNTVGGAAGVMWPQRIEVFVSSDNEQFQALGDLVALNRNPAPTGHRAYAYETHALAATGRYVLLRITPADTPGKYVITDEIEVYEGAAGSAESRGETHTFPGLASTNLVRNPSFEELERQNPERSLSWSGDYALSADSRRGGRSARLAAGHGALSSSSISVASSSAYRLRLFHRGAPGVIRVCELDDAGASGAETSQPIPAATQWTQAMVDLVTRRDTSAIAVDVRRGAADGELFLDDVNVSQLSYEQSNQSYDRLSSGLVSPHIKWAEPYYRGPTRALVIAPTWSHRETVELAQRLSLEYTPIMCYSKSRIQAKGYLDAAPERVIDDFESRFAGDWPLVIIGSMTWRALSDRIGERLLSKIRAGTGLVYVTPDAGQLSALLTHFTPVESSVANGVPLAGLPAVTSDSIITYRYGRGRVVVLEYAVRSFSHSITPAVTYHDRPNREHEYYFSLLAKACLWAAQRESAITFGPLAAVVSSRAEDRVRALALDMTSALSTSEYDIETVIHDGVGQVVHSTTGRTTLGKGRNTAALELPLLPVGEYVCSVWIKRAHETVNWASMPLRIEGETLISSLVLKKPSMMRDEPLEAQLRLSKPLADDQAVWVMVSDNHNRLLCKERIDVKGDSHPVTLRLPAPLTPLHVLECELRDGLGVIHRRRVEFVRLSDEPISQFFLAGWSGLDRGYVTDIRFRQMRRNGFDIVQACDRGEWFRPPLVPDFAHLKCKVALRTGFSRLFPYGWHISPGRALGAQPEPVTQAEGSGLPVCRDCITSADYRARYVSRLEQNTEALVPYFGQVMLSLGDECTLELRRKDICFSPSCMRDFREWAKRKHGTLERANQAWKTDFAAWDDVRGVTLAEARQTGNYARWMDHRTHMQEVFTTAHGLGRETVRSVAPGALVGIEGCIPTAYPPTFTGYHWFHLMKALDFVIPYGGLEQEFARSFASERTFTGSITGSYRGMTEAKERIKPWDALLHGGKGLLWWTVGPSNGNGGASAFSPDMEPLPWLTHTVEEIRDIRNGIDTLIFASTRDDDPIAIHYSNLSIHASLIDDEYEAWKGALDNVTALLGDTGFQYRFLATEQIETGGLKLDRYRVIILPHSTVITPDEARAIEAFVADGGLVLADRAPGTRDEHGFELTPNRLSSLFCAASLKTRNVVLIGDLLDGYCSQTATENVPTPDAVVSKGEGSRERAQFLRTLKERDIGPRLSVVDHAGKSIPNMEVCYYATQGVDLFGLLPHPELFASAERCVLIFPYEGFVHDLRTGTHHGRTDRIPVELRKGEAKLFALLREEMTSLDARTDRKTYRPGEHVDVAVRLAPAGVTDVVKLEVLDPSGSQTPYLTQKGLLAGTATFRLALALNQTPGVYRVVVTDVIASLKTELTFTVGRL